MEVKQAELSVEPVNLGDDGTMVIMEAVDGAVQAGIVFSDGETAAPAEEVVSVAQVNVKAAEDMALQGTVLPAIVVELTTTPADLEAVIIQTLSPEDYQFFLVHAPVSAGPPGSDVPSLSARPSTYIS